MKTIYWRTRLQRTVLYISRSSVTFVTNRNNLFSLKQLHVTLSTQHLLTFNQKIATFNCANQSRQNLQLVKTHTNTATSLLLSVQFVIGLSSLDKVGCYSFSDDIGLESINSNSIITFILRYESIIRGK